MSTSDTAALLRDAALRASRYLETIGDRPVAPSAAAIEGLAALEVPLPAEPADATAILADLAANVLATAWDQNSARSDVTPGTARVEAVAPLDRRGARAARGHRRRLRHGR